jgi:hypothetical protein
VGAAVVALALATGAAAQEYAVSVEFEQDEYLVPATAIANVEVYKDGELLACPRDIVEAEFDGEPVALNEIYRGKYTVAVELTSAGEKTLTVTVRHDFSRPVAAMRRIVARNEKRIAELREKLADETDPRKRRILEMQIAIREWLVGKFEARIAEFEAPAASASATVLAIEEVGDTTPPAFGDYEPPIVNGHRATSDPYGPVWVEVSDDDSGVASVDLYLDGSTVAIPMAYDGTTASYVPATPWSEEEHTVYIVATDVAGNEGVFDYTFVADRTAPTIASFSPEMTPDSTPLITVEVTDPLSYIGIVTVTVGQETATVVADGEETVTVQLQLQNELPPRRPTDVDVEMTDLVGNTATETRTVTFMP